MRRINRYIAALLLVVPVAVSGEPVSRDQALRRATGSVALRTSPRHYVTAGEVMSAGRPALYLFTSPQGGYLVTPADDSALPVLAYSATGSLAGDSLPPAMRWWLEGVAGEVASAASGGLKAEKGIRFEKPPIEPMLATRWDQGAPYNDLCPEVEGKRTFTGCAATAMAQTMNYFRYPAKGSRSISYTWQGQTLALDFSGITFDWDNMSDTYGPASTGAQKEAVATLMQACGYALRSNYGTAETAAVTSDIVPALVRYFGYARSTMLLHRDFYQLTQWQDSIYASLASGSPVLYTGQGTAGGHAFVCDGYRSDGFFHFNWGWSGKSDGWFLLSALDPDALGTGGGAGGFNSSQTAVTRLKPAYTGAAYAPVMATGADYAIGYDRDANSLTLTGGLYNYATSAMNYSVGFSIVPAEGGDTLYAGAGNWNLVDIFHGYNSYSRNVGVALSAGRYRVRAAYQYKDGSGVTRWYEALVPVSAPSGWLLTVGTDTAVIVPENRDIALSATGWRLLSPPFAFRAGMNISVEATVSNAGAEEAHTDVCVALYRSSDSQAPAALLDAVPMTINAHDSVPLSFFGALPKSIVAGSYVMYLVYRPYGSDRYVRLTEGIDVEVLPACDAVTLKVPHWQLHDSGQVRPGEMTVDMTLTCTKGCYANYLLFFFQSKQSDGTYVTLGNQRSPVIWLAEGDTSTYRFTLSMPESQAGGEYRLLVNYKDLSGSNKYLCRTEYTTTGGVVVASDKDCVTFAFDVSTCQVHITSPRAVGVLRCYAPDGREMPLRHTAVDNGAIADLGPLPKGIYLLRCILRDGTVATFRIAR